MGDNPIVKHHTENKIHLVEAKRLLPNNKYSNIQIQNPDNLPGILFDKPKILSFKDMKDIKLFLKNQNYQYKGLIIRNGDDKTKIQNKQLKKFLKLFPNYNEQFKEYKKEYENLIEFL